MACQSQSSKTGLYAALPMACMTTHVVYASAIAALMMKDQPSDVAEWRGVEEIAAINNTAQKCTTCGVPKALISCSLPCSALVSDSSAMTTNCKPVSAAAEEPTMP